MKGSSLPGHVHLAVNAANEPFAIVVDLDERFAALFAAFRFFRLGWHDCYTTRE
jgi:hypothetical protein